MIAMKLKESLSNSWFRERSRSRLINVAVGTTAGIIAIYVVVSIAINFFDFDFLFGPYGSPDRSSIIAQLDVEASDPRWLGMLKGAGNTLSVVIFAIVLASLLGLAVGVARLSNNPIVSRLGKVYVELFRNLPLLLIMFFFAFAVFRQLPLIESGSGLGRAFYISNRGLAILWPEAANPFWWIWLGAVVAAGAAGWLLRKQRTRIEDETGRVTRPNTWGLVLFVIIAALAYLALGLPIRPSFPEVAQSESGFFTYTGGNLLGLGYISALVSLSLYFSGFIAEIVRGSIQAVPHGQTEASASLGLSAYQRFTLVVLPQALRIMLPSLNNEFQNANKDSTLAHAIAYGEIVLISNRIINNSGNLLQTYAFIFLVFVITNLIISFVMNTINRNVQIK